MATPERQKHARDKTSAVQNFLAVGSALQWPDREVKSYRLCRCGQWARFRVARGGPDSGAHGRSYVTPTRLSYFFFFFDSLGL